MKAGLSFFDLPFGVRQNLPAVGRFEYPGILSFVNEPELSHADIRIIQIQVPVVVNRVTDLDTLADVSRRDFIDPAFKADGGIVVDDPFISDQKDFIQLGFGRTANVNF